MTTPIETEVREAMPRVSAPSDALRRLGEEARSLTAGARRRRRVQWTAFVVTGTMALGGTGAAIAATPGVQTALGRVWWDKPNSVNEEMTLSTTIPTTVDSVSCILAAEYAPGVGEGDANAQRTFQDGQDWLARHAVTIPVPASASQLTPDERETALATVPTAATTPKQRQLVAVERSTAVRLALTDKAVAALGGWDAVNTAAVSHTADLQTGLDAQLTSLGDDPRSIMIGDLPGICDAVTR